MTKDRPGDFLRDKFLSHLLEYLCVVSFSTQKNIKPLKFWRPLKGHTY